MDTRDEFQSLLGRIILRACANGFDPQRRVGLSALELRMLVKLAFDGPACMRDLGSDLSLPRSTMTDAADRLEAKQLIVRSPDPRDGRCVVLEAAPTAQYTLSQATADLQPLAADMLEEMSAPETEELLALLRRALAGVF